MAIRPGWLSSEFHLAGGGVTAILYLAHSADPIHTKVASITAVAAVSIVYFIGRTWLKTINNPTAVLAALFSGKAVGGRRQSAASASTVKAATSPSSSLSKPLNLP